MCRLYLMSQGVSKCRPELSAWVKLFLSTVEASSVHTHMHTLSETLYQCGSSCIWHEIKRAKWKNIEELPCCICKREKGPSCHTHTCTCNTHTHSSILFCKWAVVSLALFTVAEWSKLGSIALKRHTLERFVLQNLDTHTHTGAHMLSRALIFRWWESPRLWTKDRDVRGASPIRETPWRTQTSFDYFGNLQTL